MSFVGEILTSYGSETFAGFMLALGGLEEAIRTNSIPPAIAALVGFGLMAHGVNRSARGPNIGG